MNVREIFRGAYWSFVGIAADAQDPNTPTEFQCDVHDWLVSQPREQRGNLAKLFARIEFCADNLQGPRALSDKHCHQIAAGSIDGANYSIWQIRSGDLRLLFFYDEGRVVVCSHGFVKTSAKTPSREQERAVEAWTRYRREVVVPRDRARKGR